MEKTQTTLVLTKPGTNHRMHFVLTVDDSSCTRIEYWGDKMVDLVKLTEQQGACNWDALIDNGWLESNKPSDQDTI